MRRSWNRGLTKETDLRLLDIGKKISKIKIGKPAWNKGIPNSTGNGFRGHHISEENKIKTSLVHSGKIETPETRLKKSISHLGSKNVNYGKKGKLNHCFGKLPKSGGHGIRSYYDSPLQGQVCFRSSYELAYAKYLDSIHELWMYEMETFDLGDTTYTPDFFLPRREKFIEIKGYKSKEKTKMETFLEQYPWDLEILYREELLNLGVKL